MFYLYTGRRMQLDSAEGTELAEYLPVSADRKENKVKRRVLYQILLRVTLGLKEKNIT